MVFVGRQTSYKNKLDHFISQNRLGKQVVFLNNLPEKELAALYNMAGCSVYISIFEGFGLPVIESMASGCPVIISDASVLPETAGGAAILCPPFDFIRIADNIKLLTHDKTERNNWIKMGFERASLYHPEQFADKMINFYTTNRIL